MKLVLAITGGGSEAISLLLRKGGASSMFLEGIVPYSQKSLDKFLGFSPTKYCSQEVARQMAMRSFHRALELGADLNEATGIGVTATLAKQESERADREHRFYVATQTSTTTTVSSFKFHIKYCRKDEEQFTSLMVKEIVNNGHLGYVGNIINGLDVNVNSESDLYGCLDLILEKQKSKILFGETVPPRSFIYPGSFNPMHDGHLNIIKWCEEHIGVKPYIEISVVNPDKPPLDFIDIRKRYYDVMIKTSYVENHKNHSHIAGVILSSTPRFFDKSWIYMMPRFLVGSDTFERILDSKYYADQNEYEAFLDHIMVNDTNFYIFQRHGYPVNTDKIKKLRIENHIHIIPKSQYQDAGISSSKIRESQNAT